MAEFNVKTSIAQVIMKLIKKIEHPINDHEITYADQECPKRFCVEDKLVKQEREECKYKVNNQICHILIHIDN